ncbi:MAG: transposase [Minisyncoccia bacterium]
MFRHPAITTTGEYLHIYNRGNDRQTIFHDERDWIRFLFLILHLQSKVVFENIGRHVSYFVKHRMFNTEESISDILRTRLVELTTFTLMPNHFHLVIVGLKDRGVSEYMRRVQDAYTKYYNTKHKRTGHLLQGPYQAVHIKNNNQLLHLSAYIHKNSRELPTWKNKEHLYPWSSYQDYLKNRWGELLNSSIISEQFNKPEDYKIFVKNSSAKESLPDNCLIDYFD